MGSNDELMFDAGQVNDIKLAARRAGATNADLRRLGRGDMFARILPILRGTGRVVMIEDELPKAAPPKEPTKLIVDLDAAPYVPDGWSVRPEDGGEHRQGGQFEFDPAKIALYLSDRQKGGRRIKGHDLREELKSRPVFNANLLDFFLEHPDLIPEEWKDKAVFFWGTIYRRARGDLVVRCLVRLGVQWHWLYFWLGLDFGDGSPVAVPASA